ncbi:hypothetical protein CFHF_25410 [Caulobacter flavus]|uniref:Uncharacterized protein n=1 Tax=Caulobacter flavus TaxID=1679497 RepID=A0A2N5CLA5_9CAUL|nr:hypothetical protein [Caulobacter flavus]AYV48367.1 hypothetical protein C1707_20040 [Caulobacter flavus]PLR06527.1 hypothetical protein CFHF_25410 [Caulobacter flavus]
MTDTLEALQITQGAAAELTCNIVLTVGPYASIDVDPNGRPFVALSAGPLPQPIWNVQILSWDGPMAKAYISNRSGKAFWNTDAGRGQPAPLYVQPGQPSTIILTLQPNRTTFLLEAAFQPGGNIGPAEGPGFAYLSTGAAAPVEIVFQP